MDLFHKSAAHSEPQASMNRKRPFRATPSAELITCTIVEDHWQALPHWHYAMRKRKLPTTEPIQMLHFDAHPDLMVTEGMRAETCFRPRELYDALASTSGGIAEVHQPHTRL